MEKLVRKWCGVGRPRRVLAAALSPFAASSPLRRATGKAGNDNTSEGDEQDQDGDRSQPLPPPSGHSSSLHTGQ